MLSLLQQSGLYNLHQSFNYIRIEWKDTDKNYQILSQFSHLQLIDEFYNLFYKIYHIPLLIFV